MRNAIVVGLGVALLGLSGCISSENPFETTSAPATSPSGPRERDVLIEALNKTHASRYTFAVQANLGDDGNLTATGVVDPTTRVFSSTVKITDTKYPSATEQVVVNNQLYVRSQDSKSAKWMHVDLARVSKGSPGFLDAADPAGLARFIDTVGSVERGSTAGAYLGHFNAKDASPLPIGAPVETCFCSGLKAFRALVDEQGRVMSIAMELSMNQGPTLKMTTTMAGFDQPVTVKAPASTFEAPDTYYRAPTPSPSK